MPLVKRDPSGLMSQQGLGILLLYEYASRCVGGGRLRPRVVADPFPMPPATVFSEPSIVNRTNDLARQALNDACRNGITAGSRTSFPFPIDQSPSNLLQYLIGTTTLKSRWICSEIKCGNCKKGYDCDVYVELNDRIDSRGLGEIPNGSPIDLIEQLFGNMVCDGVNGAGFDVMSMTKRSVRKCCP